MGKRAVFALAVCLLALGLAGIAFGDDAGHADPGQVSATCLTTSATVSWAAVSDNHLSGYDVYKKLASAEDYTRVNSALVTATTYVVTGLSSGTTYDFAVRAMYNDGHTSALSAAARCTTA